jgi:hypothetical protein
MVKALLAGAFPSFRAFPPPKNSLHPPVERLSVRKVEHKWVNPSEDVMRRIFRLWRMSRNDLRLLWLALRQPNRPTWLLPATLALVWSTIFFCCRCSYTALRKWRCTSRRYRQRGRAMIAWYRCNNQKWIGVCFAERAKRVIRRMP